MHRAPVPSALLHCWVDHKVQPRQKHALRARGEDLKMLPPLPTTTIMGMRAQQPSSCLIKTERAEYYEHTEGWGVMAGVDVEGKTSLVVTKCNDRTPFLSLWYKRKMVQHKMKSVVRTPVSSKVQMLWTIYNVLPPRSDYMHPTDIEAGRQARDHS